MHRNRRKRAAQRRKLLAAASQVANIASPWIIFLIGLLRARGKG